MSINDRFAGHQTGLDSPAFQFFLISPSGALLDPTPRAIRADAAGTVTLRAVGSGFEVTVTMAAGEILPVRAAVVSAASMTVHGIA